MPPPRCSWRSFTFFTSPLWDVAVQGSLRRGLNTFEQLRQAAAASVLAYPINLGFTAVQLLNGTVYVARQPAGTASPELLEVDRVDLRDSKEVDESKCIVLDLRGRDCCTALPPFGPSLPTAHPRPSPALCWVKTLTAKAKGGKKN